MQVFVVSLIFLAASFFALAANADAKSAKYRKHYNNNYNWAYSKHTPEGIRARNLDPAGDYKAYPNWARSALSPKGDMWR
jgi:hypothetical protein